MSENHLGIGTVEELHALATESTGLRDFGNDDHLEGLRVLLDSFAREAHLTPLGQVVARETVRGALAARALSEAGFARHPEHAGVAIERPIFVTGLPRTGTTALHRLLTADPAHQGLEMWLAERPQPRPPRETWPDNPDFRQVQAVYAAQHEANPDMAGLHYMDALVVEECWRLLQQSMLSVSFECIFHVPSYSRWLADQDWTAAYARHKQNLQLIGLGDAGRRWVLKNPSHIVAVDEIMNVYPDALIIQTHRSPRTVMASICSVNEHASRGWSEAFDNKTIGRTQLDLWARGLERFEESRARYNPEQFIDIDYHDFVADPLGTAESIYSRFSLPFSDEARLAMQDMHRQSLSGDRRPAHKYALADFGLTESEVDERFADLQRA
ncbi:sulfotransferase family protein [Rhodococcus maanshanensis]|uniref:Sulfotransferase family protein n=1 Tax=Rhodococcus maanshanensis TaxID=183556 RepID=A0A1H7UZM9_9NOCA|nr:sulfotransferase [Rhodococcus maanshanensis]SEM02098.1 Sulfotransferase family protein [Rhodococcus maanshanensis]